MKNTHTRSLLRLPATRYFFRPALLLLALLLPPLLPAADSGKDTHYTTRAGKQLAPVLDFASRTQSKAYNFARLNAEIKTLKDMGFRRIFVVVDLPGYPKFASERSAPFIGGNKLKSIEALGGNPSAAVARACREQGMEAIAVFKPYENGGTYSVPDDATVLEQGFKEKTATGTYLFFDEFTAKHPEMRIQRRNDYDADDHKLPITKIEMEFMLDSFTDPHVRGPRQFPAIPKSAPIKPKINLWVSRNNADYTLYQGAFSHEYKLERRAILETNGLVIGKNKLCNVLTITGINIGAEYPYVAITLEDRNNMRLIPYSMIRWFSGDKQLKLSATTRVRVPHAESHYPGQWTNQERSSDFGGVTGFVVGADGTVVAKTDDAQVTNAHKALANFHKTGFVFHVFGLDNGHGWRNREIYGLARGKRPHMSGSLCEVYPEVRQYWLDTIKQLLDDGFAGVDIRLQNHSSWAFDYMNYGFNEPLVARYKELHGADLNAIPMTEDVYMRLMKIRGDYYMLFLEEAAKLLKGRGALFSLHMRAAQEKPVVSANYNQLCHCSMPKIALTDWLRCVELADEIVLKDYHYKRYSRDLASGIKDYAASLKKNVWIHCYYQQGDGYDDNFLRAIEQDERVSGILLYEVDEKFMKDTPPMLEKLKYQERRKK